MGVYHEDGLAYGSLIYLGVAVVLAPILAIYVKARTKDHTEKSSNFWMTIWLTFLAVFMMWIMWVCCFMHQIYPLIRPEISDPEFDIRNTTVANLQMQYNKVETF